MRKIVSQEMEIEETTRTLSRKEFEEKIKKRSERKERYEGYLEKMEREGLRQISLNDPDSRLMKSKKCLQAGIIPEVYQDILEEIRIEEEQEIISEFSEEKQEDRTEKELQEMAGKGYFVRDIRKDKVYCPAGKILRKKSRKRDGTYSFETRSKKNGSKD